MSIKIRFHGDKAIIRWKNPIEKQFLLHQLTMFRDSMQKNMSISVKDEKGRETPKLLMQRPPPVPNLVSGEVITVNSGSQVNNDGKQLVIPEKPIYSMSTVQQQPAEVVKIAQNIAIGKAADELQKMVEEKKE